ncbi:MAG: hypothetical protein GY771_17560 [bacterium]|nr:hypothetical protein [bacterium]
MDFSPDKIFSGFRELVWPLPEDILPGALRDELSGYDNLAVVEMAGRDSIAASIVL